MKSVPRPAALDAGEPRQRRANLSDVSDAPYADALSLHEAVQHMNSGKDLADQATTVIEAATARLRSS